MNIPMSLQTFFAFFSGCETDVLKDCSQGTKQSRAIWGFVLLLVVLFSSSLFALSLVQILETEWYNYRIVGAFLFLFLLLWGVDNRILHSLDGSSFESYKLHESNAKKAKLYNLLKTTFGEKFQKVLGISFRVLVIIFVTSFNVTAIGLVLYSPEIKAVINERNEKKIASAQSYLAITKTDFKEAVTKWEDWFIEEGESKASYERNGNKSRAAELQEGIERNKAIYANWAVTGAEASKVKAAEESLERVKKDVVSTVGVNDRFIILADIAEGNPIISSIGIMFGIIESLVFLLKIGKASDEYDYKFSERNRVIKIASYNKLSELHLHDDEEVEGSSKRSESFNTASAASQKTKEKSKKVAAEEVDEKDKRQMPTSKSKEVVEVYPKQDDLVKDATDQMRRASVEGWRKAA